MVGRLSGHRAPRGAPCASREANVSNAFRRDWRESACASFGRLARTPRTLQGAKFCPERGEQILGSLVSKCAAFEPPQTARPRPSPPSARELRLPPKWRAAPPNMTWMIERVSVAEREALRGRASARILSRPRARLVPAARGFSSWYRTLPQEPNLIRCAPGRHRRAGRAGTIARCRTLRLLAAPTARPPDRASHPCLFFAGSSTTRARTRAATRSTGAGARRASFAIERTTTRRAASPRPDPAARREDATLIAREFYKTTAVVKTPGGLATTTLNPSLFETVLREMLVGRADHTVEIYEGSGQAWQLARTGSPGKLGDLEDDLFR